MQKYSLKSKCRFIRSTLSTHTALTSLPQDSLESFHPCGPVGHGESGQVQCLQVVPCILVDDGEADIFRVSVFADLEAVSGATASHLCDVCDCDWEWREYTLLNSV